MEELAVSPDFPVRGPAHDGSQPARAALLFAAPQAAPRGRAFVVHAHELPPDLLGFPYYDHLPSERRDRGEALLRDLPLHDDLLAGPGTTPSRSKVRQRQPSADVAGARHADQIVVGSRGLGRVRALLGSVSHDVLHIADRPVVVIPAAVTTDRVTRTSGTAPDEEGGCIAPDENRVERRHSGEREWRCWHALVVMGDRLAPSRGRARS